MIKVLEVDGELRIIEFTKASKKKEATEKIIAFVPKFNVTYHTLINSIFRYRYSQNRVEAIINNYLLNSADEENLKEFNEMQEFRVYAKEAAKECIKYIKENNLEYGESSENN